MNYRVLKYTVFAQVGGMSIVYCKYICRYIILMLKVLTGGNFWSNSIFNVYTPQSALEFGHVYRSDSVIFF